jgi:hypothetical protein
MHKLPLPTALRTGKNILDFGILERLPHLLKDRRESEVSLSKKAQIF